MISRAASWLPAVMAIAAGCNAISGIGDFEFRSDAAPPGTGGGGASSSDGSGAQTASVGGAGGEGGSAPTASSAGGDGGQGGALPCWGRGAVCCAGVSCPVGSMECCAIDQTQAENATCVDAGGCPSEHLLIGCDGPDDCKGAICCGTWSGSAHENIACAASCTPPPQLGAAGTYPICNVADQMCPAGMTCYRDAYLGDVGLGYCY